jgi:anti-sigma regulatory factor (Ser/Thr protein kinase)
MIEQAQIAEREKYFPARPESVREARDFVARAVANVDVDPDDAALLTCEVATNALVHANSDFRLRVAPKESAVRVEVVDHAPGLPLVDKTPSSDGGRGLRIVDRVAHNWGVETRPQEKIVWFELPTRRSASTGTSPAGQSVNPRCE